MIEVQIKRFFICRLLDLTWKVETEMVDRLRRIKLYKNLNMIIF